MRTLFACIALLVGGLLLFMAYGLIWDTPLTELHHHIFIFSGGHAFNAWTVVGLLAAFAMAFLACGVYLLVAKEDDDK
jgi:hypothetical protein